MPHLHLGSATSSTPQIHPPQPRQADRPASQPRPSEAAVYLSRCTFTCSFKVFMAWMPSLNQAPSLPGVLSPDADE